MVAPSARKGQVNATASASSVRESVTAPQPLDGGPQLIVAANVYEAVRKMNGDATVRPAWLVIGTDVIEAETQVIVGNTTIAADTNYGSNRADVLTLVRIEGTFTVNAAKTVSVTTRKLGLVIYATGDVSISGTVTMSGTSNATEGISRYPAKGGLGAGVALPIDGSRTLVATGASGGTAVTGQTAAVAGTAGSGVQTGGGGGGGGCRAGGATPSGTGTAGTSWCGGCGGGSLGGSTGSSVATTYNANSPATSDGMGGSGGSPDNNDVAAGAGGAGLIPGNAGETAFESGYVNMGVATSGGAGCGGLLVLFCGGNVTVAGGGLVSADGQPGGRGGNATSNSPSLSPAMGAGGSGGGIVIILRVGTYTNSGTVRANGGAAGKRGTMLSFTGTNFAVNGGAGGAGTVTTGTIVAA